MDIIQAARTLESGVKVRTNRLSGSVFTSTFVGSDAVDLLIASGVASSRTQAEKIGRILCNEHNLFQHCTGDYEFEDNHFFYKFTPPDERKGLQGGEENMELEEDLQDIARKFREMVEVKTHTYRLKCYENSFIGNRVVDIMIVENLATTRIQAVELGRKLAKSLHLFVEVETGTFDFQDDKVFYRFTSDASLGDFESDTSKEAEIAATDFMNSVSSFPHVGDDGLDDSQLWKEKLQKVQENMLSNQNKNGNKSRAELWASTFRKLDPRYRILEHFREVSLAGVSGIEEGDRVKEMHPVFRLFPQSNVFTVWRPTSLEAIRKMILGHAVGKGLDIKGKSAKRGKLSGYVPFLQIGDNRHKRLIRTLSKAGRIRIFFPFTCKKVMAYLHKIERDMASRVEQAKSMLSTPRDYDHQTQKEAEEVLRFWDMKNSSIEEINEYLPHVHGLEMPVRLFWEAFIARQDITRKPASNYDTGRPSIPANQDLNVAALLSKTSPDSPKAVIFQHAHRSDPMNPQELLMAYEEHGRVLPVASDFDAFLVGTRRVRFDPKQGALKIEQQKTLQWTVAQIAKILDSPPRPGSWTKRWWENLEREIRDGSCPKVEIPKFGFGDPLSYKVMENAVRGLAKDGSVRHGAESFNYKYPQELDDEFLVISDKLEPIPWCYMSVEQLIDFLGVRIDEGFAFPLNPKWILCDPGWKKLYDKLWASPREDVQNAMKIWYPPSVATQITRISKSHPACFEGRPLRSQEDVQKHFVPILKNEGKVFRKKLAAYVRPAKKGEKIVTTINGITETENVVLDDTSWVVRGKTRAEYYILSREDFEASYDEQTGREIDLNSALEKLELERLHKQGFKEYKSRRRVWARKVTKEDMTFLRYGSVNNEKAAYFVAPWREYMRVEEGDILVMQYPEGNEEIYRIEHFVFNESYEPVFLDKRISTKNFSFAGLRQSDFSDSSKSSLGLEGQTLRSQLELQKRFIPLLKGENRIFRKRISAYLRRGVKGEQIATTIDGALETENTVKDDTSWVVHAKTAGESYVLTQKNFIDSYDPDSAKPILVNENQTNPRMKALQREGFMEYKSIRRVWARMIDKEDVSWLHFGEPPVEESGRPTYGMAPWNEYMLMNEGDYLVAPFPSANEVYRIDRLVFEDSYEAFVNKR